ncbi:MAG: hypothetical protein H6722_07480 [Sandaracinus sp.]|nr:hypothetical protein [Sandaracinus sp.]
MQLRLYHRQPERSAQQGAYTTRELKRRSGARASDADIEALACAMRSVLSVVDDRSKGFASVLRLGRAFDLAARPPTPWWRPTRSAT